MSYQNLSELVDKTSFYLTQQDIKENNIVCLLFNNSLEFIVIILAFWEVGAVPVPLNTKLLEKDLN